MITKGIRGAITVDENTPEAIRKEIIRYFDDTELQKSCISNIANEKERLSWHTFAVKLEEFINKL